MNPLLPSILYFIKETAIIQTNPQISAFPLRTKKPKEEQTVPFTFRCRAAPPP
jgi:hypothetical protein